jgi:hypothetical protein
MKIQKVSHNNRKKAFEISTMGKQYLFPYAKLEIRPSPENPIKVLYIDQELDRFTQCSKL